MCMNIGGRFVLTIVYYKNISHSISAYKACYWSSIRRANRTWARYWLQSVHCLEVEDVTVPWGMKMQEWKNRHGPEGVENIGVTVLLYCMFKKDNFPFNTFIRVLVTLTFSITHSLVSLLSKTQCKYLPEPIHFKAVMLSSVGMGNTDDTLIYHDTKIPRYWYRVCLDTFWCRNTLSLLLSILHTWQNL